MAIPAAYIYESPKKFGCSMLGCRTPMIYKIASTTNVDIVIEVDGEQEMAAITSPGTDGLVWIDISQAIRNVIDKRISINHFTETSKEDTATSGYYVLKFKDEDEETYTEELGYYCYSQNPVTEKYLSSCNSLKESWRDRVVGNFSFDTFPVSLSSGRGFETLIVSGHSVTAADAGGQVSNAQSNLFALSGLGGNVVIDLTEIAVTGGWAVKFQLLNEDFIVVFESDFYGIGDEGEKTLALPALLPGNYRWNITSNGNGACPSLKYTWDIVETFAVTDTGGYEIKGIKTRFKDKYDFIYSGTVSVYYFIPDSLPVGGYSGDPNEDNYLFALCFQQIDENGVLSSQFKWYGVDFNDKESIVSFTKTANRWCRVVAVYNKQVCDVGFIESSPFLTSFDKIYYNPRLPMSIHVMGNVNRTLSSHPMVALVGSYGVEVSDTVMICNFFKFGVIANTTAYCYGYGNRILSPTINIIFEDCDIKNVLYLAWKNAQGGTDYFAFKLNQFYDYDVDAQEYVRFQDWGLNEMTGELLNENRIKRISAGATILENSTMSAIEGLLWSPAVWLLTNPQSWKWEGEQWLQVQIEKTLFERNSRTAGGSMEIDVIINRYNYD